MKLLHSIGLPGLLLLFLPLLSMMYRRLVKKEQRGGVIFINRNEHHRGAKSWNEVLVRQNLLYQNT